MKTDDSIFEGMPKDPKGHIVIDQVGWTRYEKAHEDERTRGKIHALIYMPNHTSDYNYVAAYWYDPKTGDWGAGHYYDNEHDAFRKLIDLNEFEDKPYICPIRSTSTKDFECVERACIFWFKSPDKCTEGCSYERTAGYLDEVRQALQCIRDGKRYVPGIDEPISNY